MISTAVSIAALACTPALAALPLKGKIAPILTVLSWAAAEPAITADIATAESSPTICFNFIFENLRPTRCRALLALDMPGKTARRFSYW